MQSTPLDIKGEGCAKYRFGLKGGKVCKGSPVVSVRAADFCDTFLAKGG